MYIISVSKLFSTIGERPYYPKINNMKSGKNYKIDRRPHKNRKTYICLLVENQQGIIAGCTEFLQNYCRGSKLHRSTKYNIQQFGKKLKTDEETDYVSFKKIVDQFAVEQNEVTQLEMNLGNREKSACYQEDTFKFTSKNHEASKIYEFLLEAIIENKSPISICQKYDIPKGTVHSWLKGGNDLRILYSMYSESSDYIVGILKKYGWYKVEKFQINLIKDIQNAQIDEKVKERFIEKISRIRKADFIKPKLDSATYRNMYPTFDAFKQMAEKQSDKVLEVIYSDIEILSLVIDQVLNIR